MCIEIEYKKSKESHFLKSKRGKLNIYWLLNQSPNKGIHDWAKSAECFQAPKLLGLKIKLRSSNPAILHRNENE